MVIAVIKVAHSTNLCGGTTLEITIKGSIHVEDVLVSFAPFSETIFILGTKLSDG